MNTLRNYFYKRPIISTIIVMVIEMIIVELDFGFDSRSLIFKIVKEAILAAIAIFFVYLVNGKGEVTFSTKGLGYAFKRCWWVLVIAFTTGALLLVTLISGNIQPSGNIIFIILGSIVFGICIGLFEEGLFRGLFFNALLVKDGSSYNGILRAIIYSSILFGFLHVGPTFFTEIFTNHQVGLIEIGQVIGKTIQTGLFGFVLAAVYLRNHSLWSVAIIHALNDFFEFLPNFIYNVGSIGNYLDSSMGWGGIIIYTVFSLLMLPLVISEWRRIKYITLPQPGIFVVSWFPIQVNNKKASRLKQSQLQSKN